MLHRCEREKVAANNASARTGSGRHPFLQYFLRVREKRTEIGASADLGDLQYFLRVREKRTEIGASADLGERLGLGTR